MPHADRILIRDLSARAIIGDNADERGVQQEVTINLALDYRSAAAQTDRLADAVDYRAVKKAVLGFVEASSFHMLEALAEGIADVCLQDARVDAVRVTLDKPGALRFARSVAIEIERRRK